MILKLIGMELLKEAQFETSSKEVRQRHQALSTKNTHNIQIN